MLLSLFKKDLQKKEKWFVTLFTGLFLFIVLYFYEGFSIDQGVSASGHNLLIRCIYFGLLTSGWFGVNEFIISDQFQRLYSQKLLWIIWEIVSCASLVFLLFNFFWVWTELTWSAYFLLLGEFFIVSIIPLGVIYFFSGINQQKESTTETLLFESENGKEKLSIQADDFIYLTSEDNYISIFFESSGELKNRLLRNTMKRVEQEFQRSKYILRCHRSYIINPKKITRVTQESSGIKLMLKGSIEIPVSAKYEPNIKEQVEL
jgi:hypothetical protein